MIQAFKLFIQVYFTKTLCLSIGVLVFLLLTIPAIFQRTHILANLEPYPDGLLYTAAARNTSLERPFALVYRDSQLAYWVAPAYSYILIPFYYLNQTPQVFYLANIILGALTIFMLGKIAATLTDSRVMICVVILLYLSHAYVVWLPSVPMAENLLLLFFTTSLALLLNPKKTTLMNFFSTLLLAHGLVLIKYAALGPALAILGFLALKLIYEKSWRLLIGLIGLGVVGLVLLTITFGNLFTLLRSVIFEGLLRSDSPFFSLAFTVPNLRQYFLALSTFSGKFLWHTTPLSSIGFMLSFIGACLYLWQSKKLQVRWQASVLFTLFAAQFPLLLIFYTVDTRYIIFSIPLISLGITLLFHQLLKKNMYYLPLIIGLVLLLQHGAVQHTLYREIIVANLLGKTTAWQYEAIQHFNAFAQAHSGQEAAEVMIITALPPFLVDAYQVGEYRVLPLSQHQEFLAKQEYIWGNDVPYQNLLSGYGDWLKSGKKLYISNAYVTHQQTVIQDFEQFKNSYNLKLVSSGCMEACNIYEISLK